jgi:hypothetical protein
MTWQRESHSAVIMLSQPNQIEALSVWFDLFGAAPDNYSKNALGSPAGSQATGIVDNVQYGVNAQLARLEIFMTSSANRDNPGEISWLDENSEDRILSLGNKALSMFAANQPVNRLAITTSNVQEVLHLQDAERYIKSELGHVGAAMPSDLSDLNMTLNIRTRAVTRDILLNRLCVWGIGTSQMVEAHVGNAMPPQMVTGNEKHFAFFRNDVNNVPANPAFEPNDASSILREISDESRRLNRGGYERLVERS